ncbi:DUF3853 family protein [Soonwooa purpurea]
MQHDILEKPLGEVTVNELLQIFLFKKPQIEELPLPEPIQEEIPNVDAFDYGLAGLGRILGCGKTTAQKIKNSGYLDAAITHAGRSIKVHKEKAMELYHNNKHRI